MSGLSEISSCMGENKPERTPFFILFLLERELSRLRRDMQKNMLKPTIFFIFLPKLHSTHIFINLYIKMTILTRNYWSTLIDLLCHFIHLYIYMLSKPKSPKINQPILNKHYILSDSTNYSNTFINSFNFKHI